MSSKLFMRGSIHVYETSMLSQEGLRRVGAKKKLPLRTINKALNHDVKLIQTTHTLRRICPISQIHATWSI